MTVVDDEVTRLWTLLTELSAQLSANREHCESLKRQCEQLKSQAIHTGTGFTLRRFNTDITKEQFESELERFNATLVLENQALQYENRQLSMLLKDYEGTLDNVMAKFRGFAASTQQYELDSARHYEQLLLQYTGSSAIPSVQPSPRTSSAVAAAAAAGGAPPSSSTSTSGMRALSAASNTSSEQHLLLVGGNGIATQAQSPLGLQMSLAHISALVRKALRSVQGEDPEEDESSSDEEDDAPSSDEDEDEQQDTQPQEVGALDILASEEGTAASASQASTNGLAAPQQLQATTTALVNRRGQRQGSVARSTTSKRSSGAGSASTRARSSRSLTGHRQQQQQQQGRRRRANSKHDMYEGGYLRLLSEELEMESADRALERDTEIVRLERENRELRELLGIQSELPDAVPQTTVPSANPVHGPS